MFLNTLPTLLLVFGPLNIFAAKGVDASWKCIKDAGYSFSIVRVFQSTGSVDPNSVQTVKNARAAGIKYVDGYVFPCYKCGNPKSQVKSAVDNLNKNGAKIGQLWLDIEGIQYWSRNAADNVNFIGQMIEQAKALRVPFAIYTSASQWAPITGNTRKYANLKLWYAHYDNVANFYDFKPFAGWAKPTMKQYKGDIKVCNVSVDLNWYP